MEVTCILVPCIAWPSIFQERQVTIEITINDLFVPLNPHYCTREPYENNLFEISFPHPLHCFHISAAHAQCLCTTIVSLGLPRRGILSGLVPYRNRRTLVGHLRGRACNLSAPVSMAEHHDHPVCRRNRRIRHHRVFRHRAGNGATTPSASCTAGIHGNDRRASRIRPFSRTRHSGLRRTGHHQVRLARCHIRHGDSLELATLLRPHLDQSQLFLSGYVQPLVGEPDILTMRGIQ